MLIPTSNLVKSNMAHGSDPLADEILRYLVEHPEAQDTVEGIADWWLTERRVRQAIADVEAALGRLVDQGLVDVVMREGGARRYRSKLRKQPGRGTRRSDSN